MELSQYSDYSIAVMGDTKPHKDKLKELGGKYNGKLKTGPGWIFPKKSQDSIVAAFGANIKVVGEVTKAPGVHYFRWVHITDLR